MEEKDRIIRITLSNSANNAVIGSELILTAKVFETKSKREIKSLFKKELDGTLKHMLKEEELTDLLEL